MAGLDSMGSGTRQDEFDFPYGYSPMKSVKVRDEYTQIEN